MGEDKSAGSISRKAFIQVVGLLLILIAMSVVLTYIIPGGQFGTQPDGSTDYQVYTERSDIPGVPILKGIFAPVLVFFSSDGLKLFILSLFLVAIGAAFQVMNDVGGTRALISSVSARFRNHKVLFLLILSILFYSFGAMLGLFEEMLPLLPVVASLCVLMGYDSFTGFICCIVSCGFGFASAITNPFTVILASEIIGVSPMTNIWYRLVIYVVMFLVVFGFLLLYVRKLSKDPASSLTYEHDNKLRQSLEKSGNIDSDNAGRVRTPYAIFLILSVVIVIVSSVLESLRDYTVVILIIYYLLGGIITGLIASGKPGHVMKSFARGMAGAAPTIIFIAMAASVKYIFEEGAVLPTIVHKINEVTRDPNLVVVALMIYLIILVLEFFVSSSTAKAILVMGMLSAVNVGLSKTMLVLLYTFADGYTNLIFPTSPVLLIALTMIEVNYLKWIRKSIPLFVTDLVLVIGFIVIGIYIGY
ncbi:Uncharacterized membrane protein YfcC, ion transporter superfamily [Ruminococcaceae bacterium YRB3002]|nr:Uncharacterized membrane protein YfcC, ion transporter superfamily [Ruminococcaceae bacterium YRB3002]